ncbi:MAG: DUF4157 domain-containing protein [Oscillospiraceae bacterium]|jgi:hypothetical protein|nr:DUF4157 domain-containing protein [Oscillospiraceae bacterium]
MKQQIRKEDASSVTARLNPVKDSSPAFVPNSVYENGAGSQDAVGLENAMWQRMARFKRFEDHQIPGAEREADRVAESVKGANTPDEVKTLLGVHMGADFSSVRFHTDVHAARKADGIGAGAYTTGRDVYFGSEGFDPSLAAHELVHTAQQGAVDSAMQVAPAPMGGVQMGLFGKKKKKGAPMTSMKELRELEARQREQRQREQRHTQAMGGIGQITPTAPSLGKENQLGSKTKYNALFSPNQEGKMTPSTVTAMDAEVSKWGGQKPTMGQLSTGYMASGLRTTSDATTALSELQGTAFSGLSDDISGYMSSLMDSGVSMKSIGEGAQDGSEIFKGMPFKMSSDISTISGGTMDIMDKYLGRESIQGFLGDQYKLLNGSKMFEQEGSGSALDFLMGNLMNRQFGLGAFSQAKGLPGSQGTTGVSAINSFITRLPNIQRDLDLNGAPEGGIPEHMLPILEKYKAMRQKVGEMVDPEKYAPKKEEIPQKEDIPKDLTTTQPKTEPQTTPQTTPQLTPVTKKPWQRSERPKGIRMSRSEAEQALVEGKFQEWKSGVPKQEKPEIRSIFQGYNRKKK